MAEKLGNGSDQEGTGTGGDGRKLGAALGSRPTASPPIPEGTTVGDGVGPAVTGAEIATNGDGDAGVETAAWEAGVTDCRAGAARSAGAEVAGSMRGAAVRAAAGGALLSGAPVDAPGAVASVLTGSVNECAAATIPPPARLNPMPRAASRMPPPLGRRGRPDRGRVFGCAASSRASSMRRWRRSRWNSSRGPADAPKALPSPRSAGASERCCKSVDGRRVPNLRFRAVTVTSQETPSRDSLPPTAGNCLHGKRNDRAQREIRPGLS